MAITGDLKQSDKGKLSGLYDFMMRFENYRFPTVKNMDIKLVKMDAKDIERDPVVARILEIYDTPPFPPLGIHL